jgi:hypothetical protein
VCLAVHSNVSAVMTSLSEFVGFAVISIFPTQLPKPAQPRRSLQRHKSDDALISDGRSRDGIDSDDDVVERSDSTLLVPHVEPKDTTPHPAFSKPDFWMLACIMSMRILTFIIFN